MTRPSAEQPRPAAPERDRGSIITVAVGILLVSLLVVSSSSTFKKAMLRWKFQGAPAPEIVLKEAATDEPVRLSEHRGKVVLLDFWATWCPPCRKQMPVVEKLARDKSLADKLQVLSINTDDPGEGRADVVRTFMRQHRYTMLTLLDTGAASEAYQILSIPTLVVVTPKGEISALRQGVHSEQELRELIEHAGQL